MGQAAMTPEGPAAELIRWIRRVLGTILPIAVIIVLYLIVLTRGAIL
jgi:hypothetical protein